MPDALRQANVLFSSPRGAKPRPRRYATSPNKRKRQYRDGPATSGPDDNEPTRWSGTSSLTGRADSGWFCAVVGSKMSNGFAPASLFVAFDAGVIEPMLRDSAASNNERAAGALSKMSKTFVGGASASPSGTRNA